MCNKAIRASSRKTGYKLHLRPKSVLQPGLDFDAAPFAHLRAVACLVAPMHDGTSVDSVAGVD